MIIMVYYKAHYGCSNPSLKDGEGKMVGRFQVTYIREGVLEKKRWKKIGWICLDCKGFISSETVEAQILERGKRSMVNPNNLGRKLTGKKADSD